jgi:L-erythrulose 1-phosphate isomerase
MKHVYLGTNWKMHKTIREAEKFAIRLKEASDTIPDRFVIFIIPPFLSLPRVSEILAGTKIRVGAQNMHWEPEGAYTGEISPPMLREIGIQIAEIGHSERRQYFGETDYTVNKKVLSALRHGMTPLVCVGEPAAEKDYGAAKEYVLRQVIIAVKDVPPEDLSKIMLAYEPVWSIGESGVPAEPPYAESMHTWIRKSLVERYGEERAGAVPILYGGSVNPKNAGPFLLRREVDGLFIGRAAWDVEGFLSILRDMEKVVSGGPPR